VGVFHSSWRKAVVRQVLQAELDTANKKQLREQVMISSLIIFTERLWITCDWVNISFVKYMAPAEYEYLAW